MQDPRIAVMLGFLAAGGACVGSFLNVVAYRLPRRCMSVSKPRSRCPKCTSLIGWRDNIPVVSWLLLRGRCRNCASPISVRYPAVELATAALFVALAHLLPLAPAALIEPAKHAEAWITYLAAATITSGLIALTLIDWDWQILPDPITKGGMLLGPLLLLFAPGLQPATAWLNAVKVAGVPLVESIGVRGVVALHGVLGEVVAGGSLWIIGVLGSKAFGREAMGFGDVKMMAAMGGVLGLWALLALGVAALVGAVVGIAMKGVGRGRYVPFGPFLALGMWTVMLRGEPMLDAWLGLYRF